MSVPGWKKTLLSLGVVVVTLVAAEGGHRVWLRSRGEAYSWSQTRERVEALRDLARNYVSEPATGEGEAGAEEPGGAARFTDLLHPYHGVQRKGEDEQLARDLAYVQQEPDELHVMILGGSVAAIFFVHGTERLLELLRADRALAGRRIRVLHYARAGFKQPQLLALLSFVLSLGIVPDVVLSIDGYNEVAVGSDNFVHGVHPAYPGHRKWLALSTAGSFDAVELERRHALGGLQAELLARTEAAAESPLLASSIVGTWTLARLEALRERWARDQEAWLETLSSREVGSELCGPRFEGGEEEAREYLVGLWRDSSRSIRALCEWRGVRYLHVLQPALHDVGGKPPREDELSVANVAPTWERSVRLGYPMLRAEGEALRAGGERFLDASRVFAEVDEKLYRDACHFNRRGNEILAEFIAPALLEVLREPAPR